MTRNSGDETINQGGAPKPAQDERDAEHGDIAGDVAERGQEPGKRRRGETTSADTGDAIDADSAHDRAS